MGVDEEIEEIENKLYNLKHQKCLDYEQEKLQRTKIYEEYVEKYIDNYFDKEFTKTIKIIASTFVFFDELVTLEDFNFQCNHFNLNVKQKELLKEIIIAVDLDHPSLIS